MQHRQQLESALFAILEKKSSDQEKSEELAALLNSIQQLNLFYSAHLAKLKQQGILLETEPVLFSIDACNDKVKTPLIVAIENGLFYCARLLIEAGAKITHHSLTPLMLAAEKGHSGIVKLLIKAKAELDLLSGYNKNGENALMLAAKNGHTDCVQVLIAARANIHFRSKEYPETNALCLAIKNGHPDCVSLLIAEAHANDINQKDAGGHNALSIAIEKQQNDCLRLLIASNKVNLEEKIYSDKTPLMYSVFYSGLEAIKILAEAKVALETRDKEGNTALINAYSSKEMVTTLVAAGANINASNHKGQTALMRAAIWAEDPTVIHSLCENKANPNLPDRSNNTALDFAISYSGTKLAPSLKCVRALLECGAVISHPSRFLNFVQQIDEFDQNSAYCYAKLAEILAQHEEIQYQEITYIQLDKKHILEKKPFMEGVETLKKLQDFIKVETTKKLEDFAIPLPRDILNIISLYDNTLGTEALRAESKNNASVCRAILDERIRDDKTTAKQMRFFSKACEEAPPSQPSTTLRL